MYEIILARYTIFSNVTKCPRVVQKKKRESNVYVLKFCIANYDIILAV